MPAAQPQQASALRRAATEYWLQSRRPLAALAFVVPLLVLYEGGLLLLGVQAVRNGADVWLRQVLDLLGFSQYFLLPALTVGLLLAWHHLTQERWQLSATVVYVMFAECAVLGLALVFVGRLQGLLVQETLGRLHGGDLAPAVMSGVVGAGGPLVGRVLGFVGAGVYEETLFRMLLLPPAAVAAARLGARRGARIASAILLTSLVFSAAHYIGPQGDAFEVFSFSFRCIAGAFFALVFVYRGFGIAAGTHALYDIFVSLG